jgi:hypothetical protein
MRVQKQTMMALTLICIFGIVLTINLKAAVWEINLDGSADFTSIQEGISAAADGDTVLVYPGTYYENIDFSGKEITVGSLCLTTDDDSYKYTTIINGNQEGSCVRFTSGETYDSILCGFTLTNGSGSLSFQNSLHKDGGGIIVKESQATVRNTVITRNLICGAGGGIHVRSADIIMEGVTIRDNRSVGPGGGLWVGRVVEGSPSTVLFDEENLCSIYNNLGYSGMDVAVAEIAMNYLNVVVDTFTVAEVEDYFILRYNVGQESVGNIDLSANSWLIDEKTNADLYVSTTGCNTNSGLTPDESLATINHALAIIESDEIFPKTIYIADGVYSFSENDHWFPLKLRSSVSLVGESMEGTIFDAEELPNSFFVFSSMDILNTQITNFTMKNASTRLGHGLLYLTDFLFKGHTIKLANITVLNSKSQIGGIQLFQPSSHLHNINYLNNRGGIGIGFNNHSEEPSSHVLENSRISGSNLFGSAARTVPIGISGRPWYDEPVQVLIVNTEISGNYNWEFGYNGVSGIILGNTVEVDIVNCTFADNYVWGEGGFIFTDGTGIKLNIYNTIMYGNSPREFYLHCNYEDYPTEINIHNSLVMGGADNIHKRHPWIEVNWYGENLDEDPLWLYDGDYPYMLSPNSPCIDAGTLDLPDHISLPDTDLAGNPRIVGNSIDLGAYEWQGVSVEGEDIITPQNDMTLKCYPNPFNPNVTIDLALPGSGETLVDIYNIKGQRIKTLMNAFAGEGKYSFNWNGTDENGTRVASGHYIVHARQGENALSQKITLLK